jgi:hypothetical protein
MDTPETPAEIENLLEEFRWTSRRQRVHAHYQMLPMVHLFVISSVAFVCLNLVH